MSELKNKTNQDDILEFPEQTDKVDIVVTTDDEVACSPEFPDGCIEGDK